MALSSISKLESFISKAIQAYGKSNSAHLGDRNSFDQNGNFIGYIGASDIAGCPRKAVESRLHPHEFTPTTQLRFAWGHLSQEMFSRLFVTGGLSFEEEVEIIHPNNPQIRCHIDFLFKGKNRWHVVEKKATGEIPTEPYQSWVDQLHVQMGMLKRFHPEASKGGTIGGSVLAATPLPKEDDRRLVNGIKEFNSYTPNDIVFEHLMKKAEHILAAINGKEQARCEPSLICGSCPYSHDCPSHRIPKSEIPDDVLQVAAKFLQLAEEKKDIDKILDALKEDLLKYTGGSFQRVDKGIAIRSFTIKDSVSVDSKKLQKDYPEAYKACTKPRKGYVRLEVTKDKSKEVDDTVSEQPSLLAA